MQQFSTFDVDELKLVYRVLHQNLMAHIELMDADFLQDLQRWLQYRAGQEGVEISDHAQWDAWLGGQAVSCEERVSQRKVVPLPPPKRS